MLDKGYIKKYALVTALIHSFFYVIDGESW